MPEGDVVFRTCARLHQALAGTALTRCEFRWPSVADVDLTGRTVRDVTARGKHLLMRVSEHPDPCAPHHHQPLTVHSHLRMDGSWVIVKLGDLHGPGGMARRSGSIRAVLAGDRWAAIGYALGMLNVVPTADEASLVGHLGPDILGPDWDAPAVAATLAASPHRTIGEALLDQRVLAGIGTFFMSEALFVHGVTPWTPAGEVSGVSRLLATLFHMLRQNATRAVQATTGSTRPGHTSYVHARSGRPCRRCRSTVRVALLGDDHTARTAFYCPTCQVGPAPTDDGAAQRPLGATPRGRARR